MALFLRGRDPIKRHLDRPAHCAHKHAALTGDRSMDLAALLAGLTGLVRRSPALNGMRHRQAIVKALIACYDPAVIIETGTYKGHTTRFFAARARRVVTIELNPEFHARAVATFAGTSNVTCLQGSSDQVLNAGIAGVDLSQRTLFYLDAHWNEHLPLLQELEIIATRYPNALVVIDDFKVDGDPGYGFDDYGPVTGRLTLDAIASVAVGRFQAWFPAISSSQETGKVRGWIVLGRGERMEAMAAVAGLKPVAISAGATP
jgi:predicted O-methyltransferase YrrM